MSEMTTTELAARLEAGVDVVTKVAIALGEPALLVTESKDQFLSFRKSIVDAIAPRDAVEATLALRYADCSWRIQRCQRCATGVVNLTFKLALKAILGEHVIDRIEGYTPQQIADSWFHDTAIKKLALDHLKRFAVDEGTITAQAFAMRSSELVVVDDMQGRAEAEALAILREIDRRREAADRLAAAQASREDDVNQREGAPALPAARSLLPHNQ